MQLFGHFGQFIIYRCNTFVPDRNLIAKNILIIVSFDKFLMLKNLF